MNLLSLKEKSSITEKLTKGVANMVQTIQVTVPIPDGFVLIEREKVRELEDLANDPVWDLKDLKQKLKMSSDDTIKTKFLYNPKFEKQLKKVRYSTLS